MCGALKSFCRMQNLTKASTSLDSAHQEQLIATTFGVNGPPGEEQSPFYLVPEFSSDSLLGLNILNLQGTAAVARFCTARQKVFLYSRLDARGQRPELWECPYTTSKVNASSSDGPAPVCTHLMLGWSHHTKETETAAGRRGRSGDDFNVLTR